MTKSKSIEILASFATIKSLSDAKKYQSPYQILSEFIRNIVVTDHLYTFSATEMKNRLNEHFGFAIPESVVKTAAKNMAGITLEAGIFSVVVAELGTDSLFEEKNEEAQNINSGIIDSLANYLRNRIGSNSIPEETLTQELVAFLVDDQANTSAKYTELISEFVIKNEQNVSVQSALNSIREGSSLYIAINHNIGETGSITKLLTLYLSTEILFSLAGFNGEIYQQLAYDFYNQVRAANRGKQKKIALYYFAETEKEINDFFFTAEEIVEGKRPLWIHKPAMIEITNGCSTASDVAVKKSDFYYMLEYSYGIKADPHNDYYNESSFAANLESFDYLNENKKKELDIKLISHINKLRNGKYFSNDIDSEYLLVTNTKGILDVSKEQIDELQKTHGLVHVSGYAVSLDRITNLLWYKLGNGFGRNEYPASVSAILRARIILSSCIAKNAEKAFSDAKRQYESGTITEEQLAARIIVLKNKPKLPEELQGDVIDEIMDFSPEFLNRYEEKVKADQKALKEKETLIENIIAESQTTISQKEEEISVKESIIAEKDKDLLAKDATIAIQKDKIDIQNKEQENLVKELTEYRRKEALANRRRNILHFIWSAVWKLIVCGIIVVLSIWLCTILSAQHTTAIGVASGVISLLPAIWSIIQKDYKKHIKKQNNP